MLDISKQKVDVTCSCRKKHHATFQDVINRKAIKCSCGATIQLKDGNRSVGKSVSNINKAFKDLESTFKKLGK